MTADPEIPVPPRLYGGIERIVDMLLRGLVARGHQVTLFAHPDSRVPAKLVPWPGASSSNRVHTLRNMAMLTADVVRHRFDIVHSFSRLAYLGALLPLQVPKLMSYQRDISRRTTSAANKLSRGTLEFTAISKWMIEGVEGVGRWHMVPNGVPLGTYDFVANVPPDAPLVFLGRVEEIKGPHLAIEVARRTGRRLIIAGNVPAEHKGWFEANVAPAIDGTSIQYIGPVDDGQKNVLLGSAAAFLMPILWDEPFGIVMAEAMACGTPVLGLDRGAVPEVVVDGLTGFIGSSLDEIVSAVFRISEIDRQACRKRVEMMYSEDAVVDGYVQIYSRMIARRRHEH